MLRKIVGLHMTSPLAGVMDLMSHVSPNSFGWDAINRWCLKEPTIDEEHMPGSPSLLHHVLQLSFLTRLGSIFHHTVFFA